MFQRLTKIINQITRLSKNTAGNQPVDTALPPTSAIDQHQQRVDGNQTTIAGDVRTKGGMVNTSNLSSSGGGIAGGAGSKAAGARSVVTDMAQDVFTGDYARKIYIEALQINVPYNLHELGKIAESIRNEINEAFLAKEDDFALGLFYLDHANYVEAIEAFKNAHNIISQSGKPRYYVAVARCGAWRDGSLHINRQAVKQMEKALAFATKMKDSQAHYWYLWALIKYEYYELNHLRMDDPPINELLARGNELFATSTDKDALLDEIRQMQRHVKDSCGFIDLQINLLTRA